MQSRCGARCSLTHCAYHTWLISFVQEQNTGKGRTAKREAAPSLGDEEAARSPHPCLPALAVLSPPWGQSPRL